MTDIRELELAVIEAARKLVDIPAGSLISDALSLADWHKLNGDVKALDAALRPNPWQLLSEYVSGTDNGMCDGQTWDEFCDHWVPRVCAALEWKAKQHE